MQRLNIVWLGLGCLNFNLSLIQIEFKLKKLNPNPT